MRAAKVQASLRIRAVSPEPSLLAHISSESRGTFRQKARSLAPLNGWACAVKICHDGMLEPTNSLDGAHMKAVFHTNDCIVSFFVFSRINNEDDPEIEVSATQKWLVFVSAFFILMIDMGFVYSFGTLFPAILDEFGDNRASTAAIQAVFTGIGPSSG